MDWADGGISARGMIKLARSAKRDGLKIQMIENLASLGSESCHNAHRDLATLLQDAGALEHVTPTRGDLFEWCISPTEIVKLISRNHRAFQKHLCPSRNACTQFWRDFLSSESGIDYQKIHPHLRGKSIADLATTIACRVHEDSGPFTKVRSTTVISWSSMLGRGIDLQTKYAALIIVHLSTQTPKCYNLNIASNEPVLSALPA